jgi:transcriptional regulator with XRE-family HTH domain
MITTRSPGIAAGGAASGALIPPTGGQAGNGEHPPGVQVTKRIDPAQDDAGVRLRTLRLRRGLSQVPLADLACISPAFVSMIETGQRSLTRARDILALADVLMVSPLYLADGREDAAGDWLRRLAREPAVSPWLLLDQLAARPGRASGQDNPPCHSSPALSETP